LLGEGSQPLFQEAVNNDSDFEDSKRRGNPKSNVVVAKDTRRARTMSVAVNAINVLRASRNVCRM